MTAKLCVFGLLDDLLNIPLLLQFIMQARSKHKMTGGAERVAHINPPPPPLRSLS